MLHLSRSLYPTVYIRLRFVLKCTCTCLPTWDYIPYYRITVNVANFNSFSSYFCRIYIKSTLAQRLWRKIPYEYKWQRCVHRIEKHSRSICDRRGKDKRKQKLDEKKKVSPDTYRAISVWLGTGTAQNIRSDYRYYYVNCVFLCYCHYIYTKSLSDEINWRRQLLVFELTILEIGR